MKFKMVFIIYTIMIIHPFNELLLFILCDNPHCFSLQNGIKLIKVIREIMMQ